MVKRTAKDEDPPKKGATAARKKTVSKSKSRSQKSSSSRSCDSILLSSSDDGEDEEPSVKASKEKKSDDPFSDRSEINRKDVDAALLPFYTLLREPDSVQKEFLLALNGKYNMALIDESLHQLWVKRQVEVDWLEYLTARFRTQFFAKSDKVFVTLGVYDVISFLETNPLEEMVTLCRQKLEPYKYGMLSIPITGQGGGHYSQVMFFKEKGKKGLPTAAVHFDTYPDKGKFRLNDKNAKKLVKSAVRSGIFNPVAPPKPPPRVAKEKEKGAAKTKGKQGDATAKKRDDAVSMPFEMRYYTRMVKQKANGSDCGMMLALGRCLALELLKKDKSKNMYRRFMQNVSRITRTRGALMRRELKIDIGNQFLAWQKYHEKNSKKKKYDAKKYPAPPPKFTSVFATLDKDDGNDSDTTDLEFSSYTASEEPEESSSFGSFRSASVIEQSASDHKSSQGCCARPS